MTWSFLDVEPAWNYFPFSCLSVLKKSAMHPKVAERRSWVQGFTNQWAFKKGAPPTSHKSETLYMVDQREYDLVSRCPNVATQEYRYAILWDLVLKIFEQRYGHAYPRKISSQFFRNNATKNRSLVPPTSLHRSMSTMSTCPVEIEHANTGVHIWLCSEGFACTYKKIELRWFLGFLGVLYSNHGWWGRDEPPKGLVRWGHDDGAMRGGPGNCYQYIHNTKSSDEPPMSTSPE